MLLIEKKLIFVWIVAGLLLVQLAPALTMKSNSRPGSTHGSSDENEMSAPKSKASEVEEPEVECEVTQTFDFVCFFNFLVQSIFDAAGQILVGLGACLPCDKGLGECALCLANYIPVPPAIPEDCGPLILQR